MSLKQKLLEIAGKDSFELDPHISTKYVLRLCFKYGFMLIRGKIVSIGHKQISSSVFIGKNVKISEKKMLFIGDKTKIHDGVVLDSLSTDGLRIGEQCVIGERSIIQCTGGLSSIGKGIKIGDRTTFNNDCFFGCAGGIKIGNDVVAGQYVRLHAENHNFDDMSLLIKDQGVTHKGINIGNNCWIGSGAVFLDGAELGNGCVVAANAVVTKKFPDNVVIAGVPAKIIGNRGSLK